jgi:hypothetical protein
MMYKIKDAWYSDFRADDKRYRKSFGKVSKKIARLKEAAWKHEIMGPLSSAIMNYGSKTMPDIIYIIKCLGSGKFKIGITSNIKKRIKALQSNNPDKIILLATIQSCELKDEKMIHNTFAKKNVHSEFFDLNDFDIKRIINHFKINSKFIQICNDNFLLSS